MFKFVRSISLLVALAVSPVVAKAADRDTYRVATSPDSADSWVVTLKGNFVGSPRWDGSGAMSAIAFPSASFRRASEKPKWSAMDDGIGYAILDTATFSAGPVIRYHGGRYNGSNKELIGIHDVRWTVEAGAFANVWFTPNLRARAELRQGFRREDGMQATFGLDWVQAFNSWTFAVGPRLTLANSHYMRTNFGVTWQDAAWNPRVTYYRPNGGLKSYGVYASATYQFNETWAATLHGGYDRLTADAGKSPIVRNIGKADQYTIGLQLSYSFNYKGF